MTRNGKIARLPSAVRDELNRRLQDGETGPDLVAWLNGRDDVQAMLKDKFNGRPMTEHNLSEWRQGGFEEWRQGQESLELASGIMEEGDELDELTKDSRITDRVSEMAALSLARQLRATARLEDSGAQLRATLKIVRALVRLRITDRAYEESQRKKEIPALRGGA
jgi:hypothetical protein